MKNIQMIINTIQLNLNKYWVNIKFNIKSFLVLITANILYIIVMTVALLLSFILHIFGLIAFVYVTIKNVDIKNIKIRINNIIKDIKNKIINLVKNLQMFILEGYNKFISLIKSRLNQDCLGKRFIIRVQNALIRFKTASNFQFTRDIIPLITLILGKFYFLWIVYLSISGIMNNYL